VETRDINKSVKNNPDKFPEGYIFELDNKEFADLRWKNSTTNLAITRVLPEAFTEKVLYMLATILKSEKGYTNYHSHCSDLLPFAGTVAGSSANSSSAYRSESENIGRKKRSAHR